MTILVSLVMRYYNDLDSISMSWQAHDKLDDNRSPEWPITQIYCVINYVEISFKYEVCFKVNCTCNWKVINWYIIIYIHATLLSYHSTVPSSVLLLTQINFISSNDK